MIARQQERSLRQLRMLGQRRQELGPFRRAASIGDVAGNEDEVEWLLGVDRLKPGQHPRQPLVAARAGPAALDAEAVTLTDDVQVRKMRDAPRCGRSVGGPVEGARSRG